MGWHIPFRWLEEKKKMKSKIAKLEVLSPLHIGNGNVLGLIDFVLDDERFVKINFAKLAEYCYDKGIDLAKGIEEERLKVRYKNEEIFSIEKFLEFYKIDYGMFADYKIPLNIGERRRETKIEVKEFIKDGRGGLYIPGSSIKGAIRTALLWKALDNRSVNKHCNNLLKRRKINSKEACKELEKEIFGRTAHEDILKGLRISDTDPIEVNELEVDEIKIIGNPTPIPTYVENLRIGAKTRFVIGIDEELLSEKLFESNVLRDYINHEDILRICSDFSLEYAKKQGSYGSYNDETKQFYGELQNKIIDLKENEAILNMGWGGGWYSKTIGLKVENHPDFTADPRNFSQFKRTLRFKLKLGKNPRGRGFVVKFPKTRRVTIEGLPLGWIKVCV